MSWVAWFLIAWIVAGVAVTVWLWWETKHAPEGYETEHGYGPVSEAHRGHTDEMDALAFDWPEQDHSEVRHGGLGR